MTQIVRALPAPTAIGFIAASMAATTDSIAVLVLEDRTKLREGLAWLLDSSPGFTCVGAYPTAEAALRRIPAAKPDVALVDLELPGMTGVEFLQNCRRGFPALKSLVLTVHDQPEWVFPALAAGASGYLVKDTPPAKLFEAIAEVHAGGSSMSGPVARLVLDCFQTPPPAADEPLSAREREVVSLLARGFRYADIAAELAISPRTVNSHLHHVYQKLHVHSAAGAVGKVLDAKSSAMQRRSGY